MGFKTISAHVETGLATPSLAPQNQVLLQDVDEQLFVNYLSATFVEDPQRPMFGRLERHPLAVERKLEELRSQPPIWSK